MNYWKSKPLCMTYSMCKFKFKIKPVENANNQLSAGGRGRRRGGVRDIAAAAAAACNRQAPYERDNKKSGDEKHAKAGIEEPPVPRTLHRNRVLGRRSVAGAVARGGSIHIVQRGLVGARNPQKRAEVDKTGEKGEGEGNPTILALDVRLRAVKRGEDDALKHEVVVGQLERLLLQVPDLLLPLPVGLASAAVVSRPERILGVCIAVEMRFAVRR